MVRNLLAITGLAIGLTGVGVFLAVGIWVWQLKAEVNRQTEYLASRANAAGDAADHAIGFVREVIEKARNDLNDARSKARPSAPEQVNPLVQMTARQASLQLAGSIERALGAVVTASDAVVVIDAALDVVSDYPELEKLFGVHPDQVRQTRGTLVSVAGELRKAKSILGIPIESGPIPTPEQLDAVDAAIRMAEGFRGEMSRVVQLARRRVNDAKRTADVWAWRTAVGTTAVSALGLVGQLFLARFCWRKLRRLPA